MVQYMLPHFQNQSSSHHHQQQQQQQQQQLLFGFKCPADIRNLHVMGQIRDYFYHTKLIVGVRDPVSWFQSFYNYRLREGHTHLPPPLACRGPCTDEHETVCTHHAYFHVFLAQLGWTPRSTTTDELRLLRRLDDDDDDENGKQPAAAPPSPQHHEQPKHQLAVLSPPLPHTNRIFLYDKSQLDGRAHPEIAERFRQDLTTFLGLATPLPSLDTAKPKEHSTPPANSTLGKLLLDICEDKYQELRTELVQIGTNAATWIQTYFLPLGGKEEATTTGVVTISSPDYFRGVLETSWNVDPCLLATGKLLTN